MNKIVIKGRNREIKPVGLSIKSRVVIDERKKKWRRETKILTLLVITIKFINNKNKRLT